MRLQIVRFTVTKTDMSQKIPYIQGNLLSNSVDEGKMANQNILFDNRVADLTSEEFDRVQQTSEYEDSGIEKTKKKRKRDVAFINDVTPPKKKKKKTDVEREVSEVIYPIAMSSLLMRISSPDYQCTLERIFRFQNKDKS